MGLTSVLNSGASGLRVSQAGMEVTSQNITNANTLGYTRKTMGSQTQLSGDKLVGVRTAATQRSLDAMLQRQLRTEVSGGTYSSITAQYLTQLDDLYGPAGSATALEAVYSQFTSSMQQLAATPDSDTARIQFLSQTNVLAQRLNGLSSDIQDMRLQTEQALSEATQGLNDALQRLDSINQKVVAASSVKAEPGNLLDQRDRVIDEISRLVDINVTSSSDNSVRVSTKSGLLIYDREPAAFTFDARGAIGANDYYSTNPSERRVGTIRMQTGAGGGIDLIQQGAFRSGEIAALIHLRDKALPQAQAGLDEFASTMALALSNDPVNGSAVTVGAASGQEIDLTGLQSGNVLTLDVVEGGQAKRYSFIRVDDATQLPLPQTQTANPNDTVVGVSFAAGVSSAVAGVQAALGAAFTVSNPAAQSLRIVDDGAAATSDVVALSASITKTVTTGGTAALPLFIDGGRNPGTYSDSLEGEPQKRGFAQRITLNKDLLANPTKLVALTVGATDQGDPTRPNGMIERLTNQIFTYSAQTGVGTMMSPANGTVSSFVQKIVAFQGNQTAQAKSLNEGQQIVVSNLQTRFNKSSQVNVDEEMTRLIELQHSYQASARVITTANEMMKTLMQMLS